MSKAVIYYSLTGNTKEAAKEIARKLGAKLFEIDLAKPLPRKPAAKMLVGGMQSTFGRTPKIKGVPDNIDVYKRQALFSFITFTIPVRRLFHRHTPECTTRIWEYTLP